MSTSALAYSARLSYNADKGATGAKEYFESLETVEFQNKVKALAEAVRKAQHIVILTGAGISTSAGIRDFRGSKGVWTLEDRTKSEI